MRNDIVLLNVQIPDFTKVRKKKKGDPKAEQPTIMALFGGNILFAKKNANEIFSLNRKSRRIRRVYRAANLTIGAMCTSYHQVFILNPYQAKYIKVLDSNFQQEDKIPTGFREFRDCNMDMCVASTSVSPYETVRSISSLMSKTSANSSRYNISPREIEMVSTCIVISTSSPNASVRAVKREEVLWQLDCIANPELGLEFNPSSVTASETGDIYFADQGGNKVSYCIQLCVSIYQKVENTMQTCILRRIWYLMFGKVCN